MTDRRSFVAWLGSLPLVGRPRPLGAVPPIVIDATPTALYQQPDGRNNLVRVAVMGLDAPAARARVTDRRGTLVGTAGLLPTGASLAGELWVPLSRPVGAEFQIDVEVGKQRVGSRRVRLARPRDLRARPLAHRSVRARAWTGLPGGAAGRRAGTPIHPPHPARRQWCALSRERRQPGAGGATALSPRRRTRPARGGRLDDLPA